jgi:hypothetical protein
MTGPLPAADLARTRRLAPGWFLVLAGALNAAIALADLAGRPLPAYSRYTRWGDLSLAPLLLAIGLAAIAAGLWLLLRLRRARATGQPNR